MAKREVRPTHPFKKKEGKTPLTESEAVQGEMQRRTGETRRGERRRPWFLPFFGTGDGSQTFVVPI